MGKTIHVPYPLNQTWDNEIWSGSPDCNRILIEGYYENGSYKGRGISLCTKTKVGWSIPKGQKIRNYEELNKGNYWSRFMCPTRKHYYWLFQKWKEVTNKTFILVDKRRMVVGLNQKASEGYLKVRYIHF